MHPTYNGMPAEELPAVIWQKSGRSNPSGNCVEMAGLPDGGVAIRNSRDPGGPALIYTLDEIVAFIGGARDGDFDNFIQ
ncbi:MAG TPA: DUF397 domain-containing protein [Rugosimonospora sp.]|jgi:hypothetical protein